MGLFDITMKKDIRKQNKTKLLNTLKEMIEPHSKENATFEDNQLHLENFKAPDSLLKYNVTATIENNELFIEGELQQVIFLVILILFGILFTYGILVILIVGYAYYQKSVATKFINTLLEQLK